MLIAMAGMPGSGKSTAALALGQRLGVPVLDKDVILTAMLDAGVPEALSQPAAYRVLLDQARGLLVNQEQSVIVDSPLAREDTYGALQRIAADAEARLVTVLCLAERELRNERVSERTALLSQPVRVSQTVGMGQERFSHLPDETLIASTVLPLETLVTKLMEGLDDLITVNALERFDVDSVDGAA